MLKSMMKIYAESVLGGLRILPLSGDRLSGNEAASAGVVSIPSAWRGGQGERISGLPRDVTLRPHHMRAHAAEPRARARRRRPPIEECNIGSGPCVPNA